MTFEHVEYMGKTLLVKAVATAARLPILVASAPDLTDKYVGNSAKNVWILFKLV